MNKFDFEAKWPRGEEWPAGLLPPPSLKVEIAAVELEVLIEHHDAYGAQAAINHEHETEIFHAARASCLRQRLAAIAPHRLAPSRTGRA